MAFPAQGETTNHLQPSHFYVGKGGGREFVRPIPIISLLRRRRLHFSYTVRSFSSCLSARVEGGPADEPTQARSTIERWSLRWTFRPTKRTNQPTSQRTRSHKRLNFPFSLFPPSSLSHFLLFLWRGWLEAPWRFSLPPPTLYVHFDRRVVSAMCVRLYPRTPRPPTVQTAAGWDRGRELRQIAREQTGGKVDHSEGKEEAVPE